MLFGSNNKLCLTLKLATFKSDEKATHDLFGIYIFQGLHFNFIPFLMKSLGS